MEKSDATIRDLLNPHKDAGRDWYLSLLDEEIQRGQEEDHLRALLWALRAVYLNRFRKKLLEAKEEREKTRREDTSAEGCRSVLALSAEISALEAKLDSYKCFFSEPYFARMDVLDEREGYNAYYIGKKGDVNLEIVDWRAPLAVRYYQKSRVQFQINDYVYRTVLRRALSVKNGKLLGFKNEYLSVKDVLSPEEIAGRDEEILFDPYLKSILEERKEDYSVRDIIRTIQEKQFEVINRPERESFVLQGCAGSGKTMILLHRLSYLMYNNENLSPRDVLVITPSDSFNAFIDELSQTLELQKVKTTTLQNYYFRVLKNEGIDIKAHLSGEREEKDYLVFLYSEAFPKRLEKDVRKLFEGIRGLFDGRECREVAERVLSDCKRRQSQFVALKNASVRVRKCVLGEMKERKEGGFYFTKPFRALMGAFGQVEDFLSFVLNEDYRTPFYFLRQFSAFYRSGREIYASAERVFEGAERDLAEFSASVDKEIVDLRRYRRKIGEEEVFTYRERIERRFALKEETARILETVGRMKEGIELFAEFFSILRLTASCAEAGRCASDLDLIRWLYRRTVKQYKGKYQMKGAYPSDGYALCALLSAAGKSLTPRYGLVFVDEGQDISNSEYELLMKIHSDAAFNVFGDLRQNITPWRGMTSWERFCLCFELHQNYRNTNEIVEFVSSQTSVEMSPVGMHGEPVIQIGRKGLSAFFKDRAGLKAVIAREEYLPLFKKRGYSLLSETGKLSKTKINVMTVFESKGLEFSAVAVYVRDMSVNESYIAYTRALSALAVLRD